MNFVLNDAYPAYAQKRVNVGVRTIKEVVLGQPL